MSGVDNDAVPQDGADQRSATPKELSRSPSVTLSQVASGAMPVGTGAGESRRKRRSSSRSLETSQPPEGIVGAQVSNLDPEQRGRPGARSRPGAACHERRRAVRLHRQLWRCYAGRARHSPRSAHSHSHSRRMSCTDPLQRACQQQRTQEFQRQIASLQWQVQTHSIFTSIVRVLFRSPSVSSDTSDTARLG